MKFQAILISATVIVLWATGAHSAPRSASLDCLIDLKRVTAPPKFEDYPAEPSAIRPAVPLLNNRLARLFRTELRRQAVKGPNFAGAFTVVRIGCGAMCTDVVIVDGRTGQVFEPSTVLIRDHVLDNEAVHFRPDSRLMILVGAPDEDASREGVHYLVWSGTRFREIRFVPGGQACKPEAIQPNGD